MLKSYISFGLTIISSVLLSSLIILYEIRYPNESDEIPTSYTLFMFISIIMIIVSLIICAKCRDKSNTYKIEYIFEIISIILGFIFILFIYINYEKYRILSIFGVGFIVIGLSSGLSTMLGLRIKKVDKNELYSFFPSSLKNDCLSVKKILNVNKNIINSYNLKDKIYSYNQEFYIPNRLNIREHTYIDRASNNIKYMYYCLLTRSYDGRIREKFLKEIINGDYPNWVIPYIVKSSSDYVIDIISLLYNNLKDKDNSEIKKYCYNNIKIIRYYYSVMISYWNLYYRLDYPNYKDYPGYKLFVECFGFKKKFLRYNFEEQNDKWNRLWDLYSQNKLKRNHYILCDYYSGVNGEGHFGFFFNNEDNLKEYINVLKKILSNKMKEYLIKAYDLYLNDEEYTEADEYFFEHEYEIIDLLQDYSNTIKENNI